MYRILELQISLELQKNCKNFCFEAVIISTHIKHKPHLDLDTSSFVLNVSIAMVYI